MNALGQHQPKLIALGNFDGVHRGHAHLLAVARDLAKDLALPLTVMSFHPHPRRFFAPDLPPFLLTCPEQKQALLTKAGVDQIITLTFDVQLAQCSAQDFAQKILTETYGARAIVAGEDFRFGHGRAGTMERLAAWLPECQILAVPTVSDAAGQRYAASSLRALLHEGDMPAAAQALGRNWAIRGKVEHGDKRGRQLGFPTANIGLGEYLRPLYGVYAAKGLRLSDGLRLNGIANLGRRPTIASNQEWLEMHFFDFNAEIYDEIWEIELGRLIRREQKFVNLEALKAQITADCAIVRALG
jgi:riboflavin kinase / FMN adenylyltransferase